MALKDQLLSPSVSQKNDGTFLACISRAKVKLQAIHKAHAIHKAKIVTTQQPVLQFSEYFDLKKALIGPNCTSAISMPLLYASQAKYF